MKTFLCALFVWMFILSAIEYIVAINYKTNESDYELFDTSNNKFSFRLNMFKYIVSPLSNRIFSTLPRNPELLRKMNKMQPIFPKEMKFPCDTNNTRSIERPNSVHQLRPGDIDVIGAIGDSLAVGMGTFTNRLLEIFIPEEGVSWIGGGHESWRQYLTIPNIIKEFNPNLFGYAFGTSMSKSIQKQFNVAQGASEIDDLLPMTENLINRMKMSNKVNFNQDWKLIIIHIGSNTICRGVCISSNISTFIRNFRNQYMKSLQFIKNNLPRTMVHLLSTINLDTIFHNMKRPQECHFFNNILECPCYLNKFYKSKQTLYSQVIEKIKEVEKEIAENPEFKRDDNFTVILQPMSGNFSIPLNKMKTKDTTYLASDCFHLSQKGYALAATSLWNNMMEPIGKKTKTNDNIKIGQLICPTNELPFIATWKNRLRN
ncbi:phospholipase B1, membrane-associated-like [Daktulosphaira vitifoliae]|uniref:phospholipase B1, membrane-associated-like n=1 Tax=Daktulosphaira vitifoliae TaxID=58002 RepID=UPI0021AAA5EF|nr:phospholipase B1, membrane-associated-like [Daktulosphaira vitifoliae]